MSSHPYLLLVSPPPPRPPPVNFSFKKMHLKNISNLFLRGYFCYLQCYVGISYPGIIRPPTGRYNLPSHNISYATHKELRGRGLF